MRNSSLIEALILNLLLKTNQFNLVSCLRDSVSLKPLFLSKTRKTRRHSDVMADASKITSCPLSSRVKLMAWRVLKIWRWSVSYFGKYRRKTRVGGGKKIAITTPVIRGLRCGRDMCVDISTEMSFRGKGISYLFGLRA